MRFLVLGSTRAKTEDGDAIGLGARKPRSIVAALAMTPGRSVSADLLADLVWAGEPPRAAHGALHSYLSGLRRVLEPGRPARGAASVIETTDHGYVLQVAGDEVDAHAFARAAAGAERSLAPLAGLLTGAEPDASWPTRHDVGRVLAEIDSSLADWQGEPYADLPEHPHVVTARTALEQLRLAIEEARLLGLLAIGEHASVLAATETAIGTHHLRERLWAVHALALARTGRQAESLDALRTLRTVLADELGLDPSADLRALEQAVLQQDGALQRVLPRDVTVAPPTPVPEGSTPTATSAAPARTAAATVGRDAERAALLDLLPSASDGPTAFAQLVGEPGIGKTHLVTDLVEEARQRGLQVGIGRCARDDGAPPMWPWRSALAELGIDVDLAMPADAGPRPEQRAFEMSERVVSAVLAAAETRGPMLVVLDDLHWSDDATLRALTHLVDTAPSESGLCVVVTRRTHPGPEGSLAVLGEAFARRHALRLDLSGLAATGAVDLVRSTGGQDVPVEVAAQWHDRAAGNPFFLIELARLGVVETGVPATVLDVIGRRLSELPEPSLERLQTAAVVGARFALSAVAAADDLAADEVADHLDEAVARGLVAEVAPEEYAFAHALTQEAVVGSLSGSRVARRHARVAHLLQERPQDFGLDEQSRTADLARHWLAAGPSHVDAAWRAARAAADQASGLTSYPEAMRLRQAAVDAHRRVVGGADEVHYELLLELANDAAYAAHWPQVVDASFEAMTLARTLGSPERVGQAAVTLTRYCVWMPHYVYEVYEDAVDDLRWALAHVGDDVAARCQLQLSLAVELYYQVGSAAERRALAESGLTLARSLGDPALAWWAASAACMVAWTPSQLEDRLAWAVEGIDWAQQAKDARAEAVLLVIQAMAQAENNDERGWEASVVAAEAIARRERLAYPLMTLQWQRLGTGALRGDAEEVGRAFEELTATVADVAVPGQEMQVPYAWVASRLWDPTGVQEVVDLFADTFAEHSEGSEVLHVLLARAGRVEELQQALTTFPRHPDVEEIWSTLFDWGGEAEAACVAQDPPLARHAIAALAPYRGRMIVAGGTVMTGPVDGALALAHATCGELALATELAESAVRQAEAWGFAAYLAWLAGHRERLGF